MSDRDDDILPAADVTPQPTTADDIGGMGAAERSAPARGVGLALTLAALALTSAGYATWQAHLSARGDDNAQADLLQRADALDARLNENERRAARNNELAGTLREQLAESERLRLRLQEDLLALTDRGARAEALLADLARDRDGGRHRLGEDDARQLLIQAESRLRLFGDHRGAAAALDLAAQALAGQNSYADLRGAIAAAGVQIGADPRPSGHALLARLDTLIDDLADSAPEQRPHADAPGDGDRGWWGRQFDRFDHLISIRREEDVAAAPRPSRDAARAALQRARLAAQEQDHAAIQSSLRAARGALAACCDGNATRSLLAELDRLLGIDWLAALPDLAALRQRLDDRIELNQNMSEAPSTAPADRSEQESPR